MELRNIARYSINIIYITAILGFIKAILSHWVNYNTKWNSILDSILLITCLVGSIIFTICIIIKSIRDYKELTKDVF